MPIHTPRIEIGDVVYVLGCHDNYRPVVRGIVGEYALVSTRPSDLRRRYHLSKLTRIADDTKRNKRRSQRDKKKRERE